VHDGIIVIAAEEEECITVKILKQAEFPVCTLLLRSDVQEVMIRRENKDVEKRWVTA